MASAARLARANPDAQPTEAGAKEPSTATTEAVLALAQKVHDEYVCEGQDTRERLISEGQSYHDQVVGEATERQGFLVSTGQAEHDELVSAGQARRDALIADANVQDAEATAERERLITEARELSTGMVAEAQQERAEILHKLGGERGTLQNEIDELRCFERDQRARQKSYLEGRLIELEQTNTDKA